MDKEKFIKTYCENCGTQRCEGIETEWFEGCKYKWNLDGQDPSSEIEKLNKKIMELAGGLIKKENDISDKEKLFKIFENSDYGLMPAPMSAQFAIDTLCDYLLGDDFYITDPVNQEQANTLIVYNILKNYSKEFRTDLKRRIKDAKKI